MPKLTGTSSTGSLSLIATSLFAAIAFPATTFAQSDRAATPAANYLAAFSPEALPDAPVPAGYSSSVIPAAGAFQKHPVTTKVAGPYDDTIEVNETAPRLSQKDKFWMGVRGSVSPFAAVGWLSSAVYEQAFDGSPNYGQTGKGFAQRFGAAAARATSEDIFSTSILAPVLHEDPRYYVLGPGHSLVKRTVYSVTRTLVTRTDSGKTTVNLSLLGGNLAGSVLAKTYYPPNNQDAKEVLATFGGSIGGSALGYFIDEFFGNAANLIHFKKKVDE